MTNSIITPEDDRDSERLLKELVAALQPVVSEIIARKMGKVKRGVIIYASVGAAASMTAAILRTVKADEDGFLDNTTMAVLGDQFQETVERYLEMYHEADKQK